MLKTTSDLLENEANGGNWKDGYRFSSNTEESDIQNFTTNLN